MNISTSWCVIVFDVASENCAKLTSNAVSDRTQAADSHEFPEEAADGDLACEIPAERKHQLEMSVRRGKAKTQRCRRSELKN